MPAQDVICRFVAFSHPASEQQFLAFLRHQSSQDRRFRIVRIQCRTQFESEQDVVDATQAMVGILRYTPDSLLSISLGPFAEHFSKAMLLALSLQRKLQHFWAERRSGPSRLLAFSTSNETWDSRVASMNLADILKLVSDSFPVLEEIMIDGPTLEEPLTMGEVQGRFPATLRSLAFFDGMFVFAEPLSR